MAEAIASSIDYDAVVGRVEARLAESGRSRAKLWRVALGTAARLAARRWRRTPLVPESEEERASAAPVRPGARFVHNRLASVDTRRAELMPALLGELARAVTSRTWEAVGRLPPPAEPLGEDDEDEDDED